jgi:hypothetical protein
MFEENLVIIDQAVSHVRNAKFSNNYCRPEISKSRE